MPHRPHRRPRRRSALVAGVLAAAPLLASCGFDYQTDQINTISAGVNDRSGEVDVLGAVVIAGEPDLGVFAASLANNSTEKPITFEGLQPTRELEPIDEGTPVEIPRADLINLFDTGGVPVQGAFNAGDFVTVAVAFDNGQVATLDVPVVTPCYQYSLQKFPEIQLPGRADETVPPTEPVEGDSDPELGEGPGEYSCEAAQPLPAEEGDEEVPSEDAPEPGQEPF